MRLGCDTSTNGLGLANLPKYAVHGRGATKPPAPESPRTASLKPMFVLCLATIPTVDELG